MNLLEQFVTDQMQFVNKLGQFVKIARAVVEPNWWWGGCVVAFAAGVLGVLLGEVCQIVTNLVAKCCGSFVLGWFCFGKIYKGGFRKKTR